MYEYPKSNSDGQRALEGDRRQTRQREMDVDVQTSSEIEMELRFRRVQSGALETVQSNGELLQVGVNDIP